MASKAITEFSSSSSHTYDVFVSFRGEDTRNSFTSFLIGTLNTKGINVFKDNQNLSKGKSIAPDLIQAIEASRLFVVVFSKDYASSTWCLRELSHIFNSTQISLKSVLPIFYDVDPSDVRKQSGPYEEAFAKYEEIFKGDREKMEEVQIWREALAQVGAHSGWDIRDKSHFVEIENIVQTITKKLGSKFSTLPKHNLVGMESRVDELVDRLCLESVNDVRVIGISGMSGIGKTTLAHALYEKISDQFDFHCLMDDVTKTYRDSGASGVQQQLLSQCLNEKNIEIYNASLGTYLAGSKLCNAKAFIIFDNADKVALQKMFTGNRDTLLRESMGGGSRIIIISKDEHVLKVHGVDDVYRVPLLDKKEAVQLFCKNAFKNNHIMHGYEELIDVILSHLGGHPLAIEVVGSSLFGRSVSQWKSALAKLQKHKSEDIMDVLRIGYDELDNFEKEIFLDIACFLNSFNVQHAKEILDFRGFFPEDGLQVLSDKFLITIIKHKGRISMHGLLRDLGKCIVQEKSPKEPSNWSRAWQYKDLYKILSNNMAAEKLEAIHVEYESDDENFHESTISVDALSKMCHLKLLKLQNVKFSGSLDHLSAELGYIDWNKYPFRCLPPSFQASKLVELCMRLSNIKYLWKDKKPLHNLRRLVLCYSDCLIKLPDFREAQNLEWLNLEGCIKLEKIHPSIGFLSKLIVVNLEDCTSLMELPNFGNTLNLETLNLKRCIKLKQLHPSIGHLRKLTFLNLEDCTSLVELPYFSEELNIETLNVEGCIQLKHINPSIGLLIKLRVLNMKDCESLISLPNNILCLTSLEYLSLYGCSKLYNNKMLEEPTNAEHWKKLCIDEASTDSKSISSKVKRLFVRPSRLWYTRAHKDLVGSMLPSSFTIPCLRELDLSYCNIVQIPDDIGNLHFLEILCLRGGNFATLPNLSGLSRLRVLNLEHCKQLEYLPELPSPTDVSYPPPRRKWSTHVIEGLAWGSIGWLYIDVVDDTPPVAGLYIFNCPALVKREGFTDMCLSWIIQLLKKGIPSPSISSVIRGSEIPRWFNNQHVAMGSFITLKDNPSNNYSIGVACCVVFKIHSVGETNLEIVHPITKPPYCVDVQIPVDVREDVVTDKSDHIWLFYFDPRIHRYRFDWTLNFDIKDRKGFHIEVKKYGYRWIDENDLRD